MKKVDDFVSDLKNNIKIVEKFDFERIDTVFDALNYAFYPDGFDEDLFDDRWKALWILFLDAAGWSEDEYWDYWHSHKKDYMCDDCKKKQEENPAEQTDNKSGTN